jgi:hypothetical protein
VSPSRPADNFIDSKCVGDRICETIGDAVLKAVVLEAIVDSLRKNQLYIEPSKVRQLVSALSTSDALVHALNYRALWVEKLPEVFPRSLDIQKRNADAIEVALGRCFLSKGMSATRKLVGELFKDVFAATDTLGCSGKAVEQGAAPSDGSRLKEVSRIIFGVLGQSGAKGFLGCLQNLSARELARDSRSTFSLPSLYADAAEWLITYYHSPDTQSRFSGFIKQCAEARDHYAPVVGRAVFELCAKLHFIESSHRHDSDDSKVTCQDMHQLWVRLTGFKELGLQQLIPEALQHDSDCLRLQRDPKLNARLLDILFYDLFRADLLHVGVDLMRNYPGFDRVFCEVLTPQEAFASRGRPSLVTIGELFPKSGPWSLQLR